MELTVERAATRPAAATAGMSSTWAFPTFSALAALFLVVFSVRLIAIAMYGSPLPFFDEWDAGAAGLYKPYLDGQLTIWSLLSRLNEHIIFTSRILNLVTFELAGEWNVRLQMAVNGAIYAGFATSFAAMLLPLLSAMHRLKLIAFCLVLFGPPMETEIITMGMNAHFYFVIIFSVLGLRWCIGRPGFSWRWALGVAMCVLAYLSMASGAVTPLVAALVCGIQMLRGGRRSLPVEWVAVAVLVGVGIAMIAFVPNLPYHDRYKAHDVMQLFSAAVELASLPLTSVVGVLIVQLPIGLLFIRTMRQPPAFDHRLWFVIGAAGWVAAQIIVVAHGRATDVLNSRYLAVIPMLVVLNYVALLSFNPRGKWLQRASSAWVFLIVLAVVAVTNVATWPALDRMKGKVDVWQSHLTEYLASGDLAKYQRLPHEELPYPDATRLAQLVDAPEIRAILPSEFRPADADRSIVETRTLLGGRWGAATLAVLDAVLRNASILLALGVAFLLLAMHRATAGRPDRDEAVRGAAVP
jgi:hypothetical protein